MKFHSSYTFILAAKLKALKGILTWNKEVFGKVEVKKEALRRVLFWDDLEKDRELVLEEREERTKAREEFKSWVVLEEISWRQKSKELWLKKGDRNTVFFHIMANAHRRRNCRRKISINGRRLDKEVEIKEGLIDAFKNLLSAPRVWCLSLLELSFNKIESGDASKLEKVFSEEETWIAILGLNGDNAPRLDGFPLAFRSFSWDFINLKLLGFFKEFHDQGRFVRSLNATFLVLVPKKQNVRGPQ